MSRLSIIGVIMPGGVSIDGLEDEVAGLDAFKSELAKCVDGVELYVDSPGGDVLTSNVMSTMISEWCLSHPDAPATCRIGGLCASAAFNIVSKLPSQFKISCYRDSLFMAHSAYGIVSGGPEALRDNAVLMEIVNSVVIDRLMSKTTIDPLRIREAFREGREMWLSGEEAVKYGLVNELLDGDSDKSIIEMEYKPVAGEGYRYAAFVNKQIKSKLEVKSMDENEKIEMKAEETAVETAPVAEEVIEEAKAEVAEETKEEIAEEVKEELEDKPAEDWEAKYNAAVAECDKLKAELEGLKAVVAKYAPSAKPEQKPAERQDWLTMVKALNKQGLSEIEYDKAYIALKHEHKAEFEAYMAKHTVR